MLSTRPQCCTSFCTLDQRTRTKVLSTRPQCCTLSVLWTSGRGRRSYRHGLSAVFILCSGPRTRRTKVLSTRPQYCTSFCTLDQRTRTKVLSTRPQCCTSSFTLDRRTRKKKVLYIDTASVLYLVLYSGPADEEEEGPIDTASVL